jgi:hypothetical protein
MELVLKKAIAETNNLSWIWTLMERSSCMAGRSQRDLKAECFDPPVDGHAPGIKRFDLSIE